MQVLHTQEEPLSPDLHQYMAFPVFKQEWNSAGLKSQFAGVINHDTALPMAKLKDILNEVAPVIKLHDLRKYFLHICGFKEIQKNPVADWTVT